MLRKFISALLAVVIVTSTFTTMTVSATEQSPVSLSNNDVSVQGENSFGDMLSGKIEDAMAQEITSADFALSGLKIEDKTATVEYMSAVDCTILVALYDEATNKMLASGKSVVSSEEDVATITIETEEMPKYFVATAYMIDSNNAPLTDEFTTELYTEEIQMVKAMKATDFEEDRVLKLEDTDETNFAVYSEDTKVLEYKENCNIPVTVDDENGIYVFSNANDELKTLVKGDMLAYEYSADNIIILKVDTIKIDGDTVTITEGDAELEDVFDYVKIEARQDTSACEFNMDGIDDDVRLVDDGSGISSKAPESVGAVEGDVTFTPEDLKIPLLGDADGKNIKVTGDIGFGGEVKIEFCISLKKVYLDFSIEYGFHYTLSLNIKTKETIEIPFKKLVFTPIAGVVITFTPTVVIDGAATISFDMSVGGKFGYQLNGTKGENTSRAPESGGALKVEGELFVGLKIEPEISISLVGKKAASMKLPITGGLRFSVASRDAEEHDDEKKGAEHKCKYCFEGGVSAEVTIEADVKVLGKKVGAVSGTLKKDLFKFYYSMDFDEVGKGDCPHTVYVGCPVEIYVTKDGKPYASAEVWIYDGGTYAKKAGFTDSNGKITVYLPYGLYTADVDGELVSFLSHKSTEKVEINVVGATEPTTTEPTTTQPTEPETEPTEPEPLIIDSGVCGNNLTWKLYDTGLLSITGTGDMYRYDYRDDYSPWYSYGYGDFITSAIVADGVTSIGENAFFRCTSLREITIPDSVTSIGNYAFAHCTSLREITIPDSVTSIGNYAFEYCESLTEITIPDRVTSIEQGTFYCCTSLEQVIIPDSVTNIVCWAFQNCESLREITIPDRVTSIEQGTFFCCTSLEQVIIPDSVTSIGDYAFWYCTSLTEITIPDSVTSIGNGAFTNCTALNTVYFKATNCTKMGDEENLVFDGCYSLENVVFENTVKSIPDYAFCGCTAVNKVDMPDSLTSIGYYAFKDCVSLTTIDIPVNVENVSASFYGCYSLNTINYYAKYYLQFIKSIKSLTTVNFYNDVPSEILKNTKNVKFVNIYGGATSIGDRAFLHCTNLTEVTIYSDITNIGDGAFYDCGNLTKLDILGEVKSIGEATFESCKKLEKVNLPEGITSIGTWAFEGCHSLSEIIVPNTVVFIGSGAFSYCTSLTDVVIPNSVISMPGATFEGCTSLIKVVVPSSISNIGLYTFAFCTNLSEIIISDGITSIEGNAFAGCTSLTSINIPDSVTSIGSCAFNGCENLVNVNIPSGVTSIEQGTFNKCKNLKEITIPNSIVSIGEGAFGECVSIMEIIIPYSVVNIDKQAFEYCSSLINVHIYGDSEIGMYVFRYCTNLTNVYLYGNSTIGYLSIPSKAKIHYMNSNSVSSSYTTNSLINNASANVAEFDNLIAGGDYIVAVVKSEETEDLLSADNLLYIEQVTADESGNVSLEYVPRESVENPVVLIFGAERISILDVEVTALKDEGSQVVEYTVTLNGAVLTENTDYELVADDESVTINGINNYKDSITLTIVPMLIGDVNQDNMININDTTYIMKYLAELESFNDTQKLVADTNGDGAVTITDATQIQKYLASLITSFN